MDPGLQKAMMQQLHDNEQFRRHTDAQNRVVVELLSRFTYPDAYYSDVPPEGGAFTLGIVDGPSWTIERDGTVTAIPVEPADA